MRGIKVPKGTMTERNAIQGVIRDSFEGGQSADSMAEIPNH